VLLTKNERGGGLGRRGVCADSSAGDKAVWVSVGAGIVPNNQIKGGIHELDN
jgi:hypothetical protein